VIPLLAPVVTATSAVTTTPSLGTITIRETFYITLMATETMSAPPVTKTKQHEQVLSGQYMYMTTGTYIRAGLIILYLLYSYMAFI
jgi:hypothetical protein